MIEEYEVQMETLNTLSILMTLTSLRTLPTLPTTRVSFMPSSTKPKIYGRMASRSITLRGANKNSFFFGAQVSLVRYSKIEIKRLKFQTMLYIFFYQQ